MRQSSSRPTEAVSPLCIPDLTIKVADVLPEVPADETA